MPEFHTLLIFSAAVLGLLLAPGPNMAFLFAHSLSHGPQGGLAVATGILFADLCLAALTAAREVIASVGAVSTTSAPSCSNALATERRLPAP